jgi:hypothetical protein
MKREVKVNEKTRSILRAAGIEPHTRCVDYSACVESATLASEFFIKHVTPFRRWLGFSGDVGGRRPSRDFYAAFLNNGREGALALLRAYEATLPDTTNVETRRFAEAIAIIPRIARSFHLVDWDLNDYRPEAVEGGKERVGVYVSREVAQQARLAAQESGTSLSAVIEGALSLSLGKAERRSRATSQS